MSEKIWAMVGRASAVIGLVGGLLLIVQHFGTPKASLVAEVEFSHIIWPPPLKKDLEDLQSLAEPERIRRLFKSLENDNPQPEWLTEAIPLLSEYLRSGIPAWRFRDYFEIDGMWRVWVRNDGGLKASSVSLKLPLVPLASVHKEGAKTKVQTYPDILDLGDLQPGEEVFVVVWVGSLSSRFDGKKFKIRYDSGLGKVVEKERVGPFWAWMERSWAFLAFVVTISVAIVAWIVLIPSKQRDER